MSIIVVPLVGLRINNIVVFGTMWASFQGSFDSGIVNNHILKSL